MSSHHDPERIQKIRENVQKFEREKLEELSKPKRVVFPNVYRQNLFREPRLRSVACMAHSNTFVACTVENADTPNLGKETNNVGNADAQSQKWSFFEDESESNSDNDGNPLRRGKRKNKNNNFLSPPNSEVTVGDFLSPYQQAVFRELVLTHGQQLSQLLPLIPPSHSVASNTKWCCGVQSLPHSLWKYIFSFVAGGKCLSSLSVSCKYFNVFISHSKTLMDKIIGTWDAQGLLLRVDAKYSPYFKFEPVIEDLLTTFPTLVIHCEVDENGQNSFVRTNNSSSSSTSSFSSSSCSTSVDDQNGYDGHVLIDFQYKFDLQAVTPDLRKIEKERLFEYIKKNGTARNQSNSQIGKKNISSQSSNSIKKQSWFLDVDRREVERILSQQPDTTFCIRPSSADNSFALSYKLGSTIYHSLIAPWRQKWYFSGNVVGSGSDGSSIGIHGLFFGSIPHLVWYWRNYGLGKEWTPLGYY